jgi:hypothetical protein
MRKPTVDEAKEVFAAAPNLNAALKNLLKREGTRGAPAVVAFAKEFRAAAVNGAKRDLFVERNFDTKEFFFLGTVRYAFPQLIESSVGAIVDKYADDFNATYERHDDGVRVINPGRFKEIVVDVLGIVSGDLKAAELPDNNFMQRALLATVFELDVFSEVLKVLEQ